MCIRYKICVIKNIPYFGDQSYDSFDGDRVWKKFRFIVYNINLNLKSECDKSWRQLCHFCDVFKNWRTIKEVLVFQYTYIFKKQWKVRGSIKANFLFCFFSQDLWRKFCAFFCWFSSVRILSCIGVIVTIIFYVENNSGKTQTSMVMTSSFLLDKFLWLCKLVDNAEMSLDFQIRVGNQ